MSKIIEFFNQNEQRYIDKFSVSPLIANVLAANDVSDEHVRELLCHDAYVRSENELFLNAKRIIESAIMTKKKILICGDYDADGLCATSIMVRSLRKAGADVGFYIPDRFIEGYGLSKETIVKAYEKGYTLFITVDNGVAAFQALEQSRNIMRRVRKVSIHLNNVLILPLHSPAKSRDVSSGESFFAGPI